MINLVMIEGRLTKDLDVRKTEGKEIPYTNFSLANDRGFGDSKKVNFFDVMVFGEIAERMEKAKVKKGSHIYLRGILDQSSYEKDGVKRNSIKIVVNSTGEWGYISDGQKPENANNNTASNPNQPANTTSNGNNYIPPDDGPPEEFMTISGDVLPF